MINTPIPIEKDEIITSAVCPFCGRSKMNLIATSGYAFACPECNKDFYLSDIKDLGADCKTDDGIQKLLQISIPVGHDFYEAYKFAVTTVCIKTNADWQSFDNSVAVGMLDIGWTEKAVANTNSDNIQAAADEIISLHQEYVENMDVIREVIKKIFDKFSRIDAEKWKEIKLNHPEETCTMSVLAYASAQADDIVTGEYESVEDWATYYGTSMTDMNQIYILSDDTIGIVTNC